MHLIEIKAALSWEPSIFVLVSYFRVILLNHVTTKPLFMRVKNYEYL